jgi:predicted DNA-binding helix-hairpin-helix protein
MVSVISKPDTREKLEILSTDAQYDLACACGTQKDGHRKRGPDGKWLYPVALPQGGQTVLLKTLISNHCTNDCKYCPLRANKDVRRCTLEPEEVANVFMDYHRRRIVHGLFLSSGCIASPNSTMARLNAVADILRRKNSFKGYIHLKIIPGASKAAIEQALRLADAVSLNIETPGEQNLRKLSDKKDYIRDIIEPIKYISNLTAKGNKFAGKKQTTQFIVGAAGEKDAEIVKYAGALYKRLRMGRIYFSAYQSDLGEGTIVPPNRTEDIIEPEAKEFLNSEWVRDAERGRANALLNREHRLYQVDFLMRKYGFDASEFIFEGSGNLSLNLDPKEVWARNHPEFFPINVNNAEKHELLRVPGLGPVSVNRLLKMRRQGRFARIEDIGRPTKLLTKAAQYLTF